MEDNSEASQHLELVCGQCGHQAVYPVGTITLDTDSEGEPTLDYISFSDYFRCAKCGGPGPWEVVDKQPIVQMIQEVAQGGKAPGLKLGRKMIVDETFIQTPAIAEEVLVKRREKEPQNAEVHSALGALYRRSGQSSKAEQSYRKALEINPHEFEARMVSLWFARQSADYPAVAAHLLNLLGSYLAGHKPSAEEAAERFAIMTVEMAYFSAGALRENLLDPSQTAATAEVSTFIKWLLEQEGDAEKIIEEAAGCLLRGEAAPPDAFTPASLATPPEKFPVDLVPSLQEAVQASKMNGADLKVVLLRDNKRGIRITDRTFIPVADDANIVEWQAPPLSQMFRGDRKPPADMDHYPEEYVPHFFFIEKHLVTLFNALGERTDQEMEEIFSTLRRRPDARSLHRTHDFVWQVAALLLGSHVVSEAEFEALFGALTRSSRAWAQRPVSRNYAAFLNRELGAK